MQHDDTAKMEAPPTVKESTVLERHLSSIQMELDQLSGLETRLANFRDRLEGPRPQETPGDEAEPSTILDRFSCTANRLQQICGYIDGHVEALERIA